MVRPPRRILTAGSPSPIFDGSADVPRPRPPLHLSPSMHALPTPPRLAPPQATLTPAVSQSNRRLRLATHRRSRNPLRRQCFTSFVIPRRLRKPRHWPRLRLVKPSLLPEPKPPPAPSYRDWHPNTVLFEYLHRRQLGISREQIDLGKYFKKIGLRQRDRWIWEGHEHRLKTLQTFWEQWAKQKTAEWSKQVQEREEVRKRREREHSEAILIAEWGPQGWEILLSALREYLGHEDWILFFSAWVDRMEGKETGRSPVDEVDFELVAQYIESREDDPEDELKRVDHNGEADEDGLTNDQWDQVYLAENALDIPEDAPLREMVIETVEWAADMIRTHHWDNLSEQQRQELELQERMQEPGPPVQHARLFQVRPMAREDLEGWMDRRIISTAYFGLARRAEMATTIRVEDALIR
ncbi:MAG: hypothetical protein Q9222_001887 [Ikaeria aurantiellina]